MVKSLTTVGNSKALILPRDLIRKYNLTEVIIREDEEQGGILILPATKQLTFQERLAELKRNKKKVYAQMKKDATNPEVQHYYEQDALPDIDTEILEE